MEQTGLTVYNIIFKGYVGSVFTLSVYFVQYTNSHV